MSRKENVNYLKVLTEEQKNVINFQFHSFGDRGSSSVESAAIGGFAHATQFYGTDNFNSLLFAKDYYGSKNVETYSVFATEHSTTTAHGIDGEEDFVYRMLTENPTRAIMSFVADSYDVYNFTEFCTNPDGRIRKLIKQTNQKLVIRPDSGDPIEVLDKVITIMRKNKCGSVADNGKYYLENYAILWGDGITPDTISLILKEAKSHNFAAENFVFGSGGDLMQNVNRDTQKFAIKCSSINVNGKQRDVFKNPITDKGKASKKGEVTTYYSIENKEYFTDIIKVTPKTTFCVLEMAYYNGKIVNETTLSKIRDMLI
jgi:nicotinamide phosphoribosyltransferase